MNNPPTILINYPVPFGSSDSLLLSKVNPNDDTVWEYNIPLDESGMDSLNGIIDITLIAADKYGNALDNLTGNAEMRIDNLPAVFLI